MSQQATAWGVLIGIMAVSIVVLNTFFNGWIGWANSKHRTITA